MKRNLIACIACCAVAWQAIRLASARPDDWSATSVS